ncbi:hypothetical protein [Desulfomonile tiedjei]|uniref:Uncharacterized protein n=1 Tax=Desulfomonile tiedjei (strain ATCC 49306 / DSM 6799 / DCB-1) TaxID=706587 RepID=I4CCG7_DESTA|nr:hypothetical protein [Desulfomonile tiedjei]AFM27258.1 hypothetical protein Desti_4634 [Desulfomonile tiedjei DSM 6799]
MIEQLEGKAKRHWTYRELASHDDLGQGDIVPKTSKLASILGQKCSEQLGEEITHVLVLTQSCDLVRRKSKSCKAPVILVAPVRPLWSVIIDQIATYQSDMEAYAGICRQSAKAELRAFLESLINNNKEDYFYLHPDADVGIADHSCAYLRLCFGLNADEYYDHLKENRTVSLTEPFANKLGWHMGWLYARVGTEDRVPDHSTKNEFGKIISTLLPSAYPWVDDAKLNEAIEMISNACISECGLPSAPEELLQLIEIMPGKSSKDKVLDSIRAVLMRSPAFNDNAIIQLISNTLKKDSRVKQLANSEELCRSITDHLTQNRVFSNDIIIERISSLLNAHDQFATLSIKDALLEKILSQLRNTRFLDNDVFANKLCNLVSGDPQFRRAMKES